MNDPEFTLATSRAGLHAAAMRDGRHAAAAAQTQPIRLAPVTAQRFEVVTDHPDDACARIIVLGSKRMLGWFGDEVAACYHPDVALRNARAELIAAAPELLEALEALAGIIANPGLHDHHTVASCLAGARETIAMAKGRRS